LRLRNLRDNLIGDVRPALITSRRCRLRSAHRVRECCESASCASDQPGKETGIRSAVGGDRSRMLRQLLTENLVLALMGGRSV
jgi:hypothetical protein